MENGLKHGVYSSLKQNVRFSVFKLLESLSGHGDSSEEDVNDILDNVSSSHFRS